MFFSRPGGYKYVNRGDPAAVDFDANDLTTNGAWHDLDLSSIIPINAKLVHIRLTIRDDAAGKYAQFRKNGQSNTPNVSSTFTQVVDKSITADVFVVPDSAGKIEYLFSSTTWSEILICVAGWLV